MTSIVTVTMDPAVDLSAVTDGVEPERKTRCRDVRRDPGGGIHVARVLKRLGCECRALYPAGGSPGTLLHGLLDEEGIDSDAWVVLPDHLHCVWTLPARDADFSTRWRLIKSRFSRGLPKGRTRPSHEARGERGAWQRRFREHHIRDETDYRVHVRYCWSNPVKHGLAERPEDWPYSSVHRAIAANGYDPVKGA